VHGVVALGQQLEDADAGRVAEGPEELGLGLVQRNAQLFTTLCVALIRNGAEYSILS
jgi:hypothetical protein